MTFSSVWVDNNNRILFMTALVGERGMFLEIVDWKYKIGERRREYFGRPQQKKLVSHLAHHVLHY